MAGKKIHIFEAVGTATGKAVAGSPMAQAFRPLPDNHECYSVVGLIAAETARIDHLMDMANGPHVSFTKKKHVNRHLARFVQLFEANDPRIKELLKQHAIYFERRNRAIHDPWLEEVNSGDPHQRLTRGEERQALVPKKVEQLKRELDELRKLRERVEALVNERQR